MAMSRWSALALSGLLALTIAGTPASAQKPGGTLVQITQPEPPNLAPYISTSAPISQVTAKVYDGLLEYGFDLKPKASLAESWEVAPDGKTVTFKLRKDVKFHDGKPFTSADVQFTIMEVLKKAHPRGINTFRDVTAVETPDDYTAVFKLNNAAPYMLAALSGYESPMLPKHVFGQGDIKSHPNANNPIGTGPFKFVEWRRGELVRLDKNPDYWRKGLPYLDRIVVRFINDEATRTAALEKGEAHVAGFGAVPYSDAKKLAQLPSIEVTTKGYEMISPVVELLINTKKAPLWTIKRCARRWRTRSTASSSIDNIWFGYGKPATGPISSNFAPSGIYTADVTKYQTPDGIEKANKLLDEAGFPQQGRRRALRDRARHHALRARVAALRRGRATAAGQDRHQGVAALRGRGDVAQARLQRLRFLPDLQLPLQPARSGDRRASRHPRQADQAGHRVRERLAVEQSQEPTS